MKVVWLGLICEAIFAAMISLVIHISPYGIGEFQSEYVDILKNVWIFVAAGIMSNSVAGLLNVFFISKWKILTKGRVFWIRSFLSTCISEFVLIFITVIIAFIPFLHFSTTMRVFYNAYFLEIIYAIIFVFPAQMLVRAIRNIEGIDAYDYGTSYNPFKFI